VEMQRELRREREWSIHGTGSRRFFCTLKLFNEIMIEILLHCQCLSNGSIFDSIKSGVSF
jgi:hypothetical protein